MIKTELKDKFRILYATSREQIKQNAARDARRYVLALMDVLREMYDGASVVERAKIMSMINQWLHVAKTLREEGITTDIIKFYGLNSERAKFKEEQSTDEREQALARLDKLYDTQKFDWCADIFERNKSSVVTITGCSKDRCSSGTGFVIRDDGYLLTNHHVVYDASSRKYFSELTMESDDDLHEINVVAADKKSDVALCAFDVGKIKKKLCGVPMISDYSKLRQGADVLVIGNAFSLGLAPFTGTVRFTHDDNGNLVYTAPSNPGDSGGPVLNHYGECVGINKSVTTSFVRSGQRMQAQGLTNATPADKIRELLTQWIG